MTKKNKIIIVGAGITGASTAYHLAKNGWNTVLIERAVLTSGTTWHAAGMVTQLGTTPQITKIRKSSVKFYKDLKGITGQGTSFRHTGTINIATTKSRYQEYLRQLTTSKLLDLDIDIINKKKFNLKIGVLTFEPMPKMFFNKKFKNFRISNVMQKKLILENLGVDFIITKKFNKKFSVIKSDFFIREILSKKLKAQYIFVSNNFRFGYKREGDVKELVKNEKKYQHQYSRDPFSY